nr:hydantoinase/oxoprolinase family protein [Comamonas koreensis]
MATSQVIRAGADIGGTFTDIALEVDGVLFSEKVLTDYEKPERAIVTGLKQAAAQAGIAPAQIGTVIHGTTLATNSLIERRGAKTAFITSEGFRDVIEMRNEGRFEQYDLAIQLPAPLIARNHRYTVQGRLDAKGQELQPLDEAEVQDVIAQLREGAYDSVAVGLMHSYKNPAHEKRVRALIVEALPQLSVSISSEVSPQIREFERFNTVCANAYVKPLMSSYLQRLAQALVEEGMHCPLYLIHSGGGLMSLANAAEFPVRLLESGPAGGAIYASDFAAKYGQDKVVSFDMGGTTAKICLIDQHVPKTARVFEVARSYRFKKGSGMPISIPVIEMIEIGAGGGSIAHVDDMRQVRVGPESAGSEPGPASYGRGGARPTVTDADLLLHKLDPARFAGGSMRLNMPAAQDAMATHVGQAQGLDAVRAAYAVAEVVDENMANAARMHAVESGQDLEAYTMIAYGGAAPLHAVRLCEKLGIHRLLIPTGAGVGSAIGFLRAPFAYESLRSSVMRMSQFDGEAVNAMLREMEVEVSAFLHDTGYDGETVKELRAFMRYCGQGWEIPVSVPVQHFGPDSVPALNAAFVQNYVALFGHAIDGLDIEVVSWALSLRSKTLPPAKAELQRGGTPQKGAGTVLDRREVFDGKQGQFYACDIYERLGLPRGQAVPGPVVIVEKETSTYVSPGFKVVLQADDCMLVERMDSGV